MQEGQGPPGFSADSYKGIGAADSQGFEEILKAQASVHNAWTCLCRTGRPGHIPASASDHAPAATGGRMLCEVVTEAPRHDPVAQDVRPTHQTVARYKEHAPQGQNLRAEYHMCRRSCISPFR